MPSPPDPSPPDPSPPVPSPADPSPPDPSPADASPAARAPAGPSSAGRRPLRWLLTLLALLVALSLFAAIAGLATADPPASPPPASLASPATVPAGAAVDRQELRLDTDKGRFSLRVEVVDTPEGWQRGLMGRTRLAADEGMLFDYGQPRQVTMWMKDTPLSLDMIFVDADGRVVRVAEATEPYSLARIPSFQPVLAVLEVEAGTARRLGIGPGSRLEHPIFARPGP